MLNPYSTPDNATKWSQKFINHPNDETLTLTAVTWVFEQKAAPLFPGGTGFVMYSVSGIVGAIFNPDPADWKTLRYCTLHQTHLMEPVDRAFILYTPDRKAAQAMASLLGEQLLERAKTHSVKYFERATRIMGMPF